MKIYTLETFSCEDDYQTTVWFYATTKEKAIELARVLYDKALLITDEYFEISETLLADQEKNWKQLCMMYRYMQLCINSFEELLDYCLKEFDTDEIVENSFTNGD